MPANRPIFGFFVAGSPRPSQVRLYHLKRTSCSMSRRRRPVVFKITCPPTMTRCNFLLLHHHHPVPGFGRCQWFRLHTVSSSNICVCCLQAGRHLNIAWKIIIQFFPVITETSVTCNFSSHHRNECHVSLFQSSQKPVSRVIFPVITETSVTCHSLFDRKTISHHISGASPS